MKYAWLTKHQPEINISLACKLLGISRTQYYTWLKDGDKRDLKQRELDLLISQIKTEYALSEKTYGSRKITKRLKINNMKVGKKGNNQGIIFCPYIMVNNVMKINEDVFSPSKIINSRYATTMVNSAYYGSILKETRNNKRKKK